MYVIPMIAIPHFIAALKDQVEREKEMAITYGEDWPEDYDANDLPLYELILRKLEEAFTNQREEIGLSGKPLMFMFLPLPAYLESKGASLKPEERRVMEQILKSHNDELAERTRQLLANIPNSKTPE